MLWRDCHSEAGFTLSLSGHSTPQQLTWQWQQALIHLAWVRPLHGAITASQMLEAEAQRVAGNEPLMSSESQCHVSCVWYCVLDLGRKSSTRFYNLGLQTDAKHKLQRSFSHLWFCLFDFASLSVGQSTLKLPRLYSLFVCFQDARYKSSRTCKQKSHFLTSHFLLDRVLESCHLVKTEILAEGRL